VIRSTAGSGQRSDGRIVVGVNLKAYLGSGETHAWIRRVAAIAAGHRATSSGMVELFVMPAAPLIQSVIEACSGSPVHVGAQHVSGDEPGAHTGEVTAQLLSEIGCRYVLVGHAERRLRGESDREVALRVQVAIRHDLVPVICVGEQSHSPPETAAEVASAQLERALSSTGNDQGRVLVAYEPVWAIGAAEPAPADHIGTACAALRAVLGERRRGAGSRVIYGGSAGPGTLSGLGDSVDGLFLGRFAHDPEAISAILDEIDRAARY
jgi:triosephosphate isomerase